MSADWLGLSGLPQAHLTALRFRYGEPWRHYHVWGHIEALFTELTSVADRLGDAQAAAVAVLYHDAVYDPRSDRNERYSAELMAAECADILDTDGLAAARAMILATEAHAMPEDVRGPRAGDMACFLDADLAILGASPEDFDIYEMAIRREYAHVPQADYRRGRAAVLGRFLARPVLYCSEHFRTRYEARARDNLRRSLRKLG